MGQKRLVCPENSDNPENFSCRNRKIYIFNSQMSISGVGICQVFYMDHLMRLLNQALSFYDIFSLVSNFARKPSFNKALNSSTTFLISSRGTERTDFRFRMLS